MRLFIGIFPEKDSLDYLRDYMRLYSGFKRNLKFAPVDQLHITLKYIGSNVSDNSKELIRKHLYSNQSQVGETDIDFNKLQFGFKYDSFPRILMANVKVNDKLLDAADNYHEIIKSLKLRDTIRVKGKFSSTYHVTLGRLKENASRSSGKSLKQFTEEINNSPKFEPHSFIAKEAYLVESVVKPGKPVTYRKLEKLNL